MITVEKARQLRAIIERGVIGLNLTPAEALAAVELYPAWESEGKAYTVGNRVQRDGKLYECYQAHSSQSNWAPGGGAASLWGEVTVDPVTGYDEWQQPTGAQDAYSKSDRVAYNGSVYESVIDGNTWSPEAYPAGWTLVS